MITRSAPASGTAEGMDYDRRTRRGSVFNRAVSRSASVKTILTAIAISSLASFVAWGANKYDTGKLDADRFVLDSARRDGLRITDRALLERIDSRVGEMYCSRVPAADRGGCR